MPRKKEVKTRKDGLIEKKASLKDVNGNIVKDANGKAMVKHFYGKSDKEIKKQIDQWQYDFLLQAPTSNATFSVMADNWLNNTIKGTVQPSTYRSYKGKVGILKEYFKNETVSTITHEKMQTFFLSLAGKSKSTIRKYYIVAHAIFKLAIKRNLIYENPCEDIKFPLMPEPEERRFYTKEQARIMLDFAREDEKGLGPFIQLKTGVRPGELLALNFERDFDMRNSILRVSKAIKEGEGYIPFEGPTKNYQNRDIPIDKELKQYLKSKKLTGYLFHTENGAPRRYEIYKAWFHDKFLESANEKILQDKKLKKIFKGCTDFTPYEYRHTFGTLAYRSGTELLDLKDIMGHKSLEITKIYIHNDSKNLKRGFKLDF